MDFIQLLDKKIVVNKNQINYIEYGVGDEKSYVIHFANNKTIVITGKTDKSILETTFLYFEDN